MGKVRGESMAGKGERGQCGGRRRGKGRVRSQSSPRCGCHDPKNTKSDRRTATRRERNDNGTCTAHYHSKDPVKDRVQEPARQRGPADQSSVKRHEGQEGVRIQHYRVVHSGGTAEGHASAPRRQCRRARDRRRAPDSGIRAATSPNTEEDTARAVAGIGECTEEMTSVRPARPGSWKPNCFRSPRFSDESVACTREEREPA